MYSTRCSDPRRPALIRQSTWACQSCCCPPGARVSARYMLHAYYSTEIRSSTYDCGDTRERDGAGGARAREDDGPTWPAASTTSARAGRGGGNGLITLVGYPTIRIPRRVTTKNDQESWFGAELDVPRLAPRAGSRARPRAARTSGALLRFYRAMHVFEYDAVLVVRNREIRGSTLRLTVTQVTCAPRLSFTPRALR